MTDYAALIAKWNATDGTPAARLAAINAETITADRDVPLGEIESYLRVRGLMAAMEDWIVANPDPGAVRTAVSEFVGTIKSPHISVIRTSDPATRAAAKGMLDAVVLSGSIEQSHADDLWAMTQEQAWWTTGNGYPATIGDGDLVLAGIMTAAEAAAAFNLGA